MNSNQMETAIRETKGFPIIDVTGEIDISTHLRLKDLLYRTLDDGATSLLVNMTNVRYMDSSGFGTLLGVTKRIRPSGGTVNLIGCNQAIQRMLKITHLNTIFGLYETEDEAIRALGNRNGL